MRSKTDSLRSGLVEDENPSYARLRAAIEELDEARKEIGAVLSSNKGNRESNLPAARRLYRERRMRSVVFPDDIFGEPAWDIILDLYVAKGDAREVPVTSACIGAGVPATTALRWLRILEGRNIVERYSDEEDSRRTYVKLTENGIRMVDNYFEKISNI